MNARLGLSLCLCLVAVSPVLADDVTQVVWFDGPGFTLFNGDTNGDFQRDMSDAVYLLSHLYLGGPQPADLAGCEGDSALRNGDSNGDGSLDVSDGVSLVSWLYAGGAEPVPPCLDGFGAGATVVTSAGPVPVNPAPSFNICNGDTVLLTGEGTIVSQTVISPSGNVSMTSLVRWHAISGTGIPSGQEYVAVGGFVLSSNTTVGSTLTLNADMRFITPGSEGDHHATARLHITINANGEITANVSTITFECRADN